MLLERYPLLNSKLKGGIATNVRGKPATMSTSGKKPLVSDAGAWAMNILSSVGIIMANKQVMSAAGYDFRYGKNV